MVGGVDVLRDPNYIVYRSGDVLIWLSSGDPATFDAMQGFVVPFLQGQPT